MHPSTCLSLTVGTKRRCSRNCQRPLAWYKNCPCFPLSIALIDHNSLKPLSLSLSLSLCVCVCLSLSLSLYIYIYIYSRHSFLCLHKMQSP
jgi:hypothetical protein